MKLEVDRLCKLYLIDKDRINKKKSNFRNMRVARIISNFYAHIFYLVVASKGRSPLNGRGKEEAEKAVPTLMTLYPHLVRAIENLLREKGNADFIILSSRETFNSVLSSAAQRSGIEEYKIQLMHPNFPIFFFVKGETVWVRISGFWEKVFLSSVAHNAEYLPNWIPTRSFDRVDGRYANDNREAALAIYLTRGDVNSIDNLIGQEPLREDGLVEHLCKAINTRTKQQLPFYDEGHPLGNLMRASDAIMEMTVDVYQMQQRNRRGAVRFPVIENNAQWNHSGDDHTG